MILVLTATGCPGVDPRCMDKKYTVMKQKHGLYLSLIFVCFNKIHGIVQFCFFFLD